MIDKKYTKSIHSYSNELYEQGITSYTFQEYKILLENHLKEMEKEVVELQKQYPNASDFSIVVSMDACGYDGMEYTTRIVGHDPLNERERAKIDEGEKNRAENTDRIEKQQLAYLLSKHPNYKP